VRENGKAADPEKAGRASPDPPSSQTAFERFEEFARRVISVPKTEIEERERLYREGRKRSKP
jgi:hypothetical protein